MFIKKTILRIVTVLITIGILAVSLSGCNNTQASQANSNGQPGINASQMQDQEKTELAALVKSGTITQSQSDKIMSSLSSMPTGRGQKRTGSSSGSSSNWKGRTSGSSANGSSGAQHFSPLNALVKDGTLTQAQADAVTKALFTNRFSNHTQNSSSN
jgi:uncharacterized protein YceK